MKISQSFNSEEIAILNKEVHEIHVSLYPEYFKEYDFEEVNEFYKKIVSTPNYYFLSLQMKVNLLVMLG